MKLRNLPGLGPKSEQMLVAAGVDSITVLRQLGAIKAFIKVSQHQGKTPSLNLLYALVGALEGEHWLTIAKTQRAELVMALEGLQQLEPLFADEGKQLQLLARK
ncbi:TfoX/Sxy family protein [Motilimonas cestriensis]|uniref:TfoX/Sxy family protein n=1 Tax=Motilimonas cestriensis TaxID=2742685 RepID=A0ABS8W3Y1_9GAMM|nr:TfoX/Sxy family protein [Motilimonas cestriensis]MCE2593662.1 TfoX/Sxy family protein [Motilimonas cestriensis]